MASLTIRGLDEILKSRLRIEAARQGCSMEETARRILRNVLMGPEIEGGLGSRIHGYFAAADAYLDLELPPEPPDRPPIDFSGAEYGDDQR